MQSVYMWQRTKFSTFIKNGFIDINFSAWGDGVFLGIQTLIIAILVMHYNGDTAKATAFLSAYLAVICAANSGLTPIHVLWTFQAMNIPIVLISKVHNLIIGTTYSWEHLAIFISQIYR